jgi:hypothetical protein
MLPLSHYSQFGILLVALVIGHARALVGPLMHRNSGVSSGKIAMNAATVMATMPAADLTPAVDKFVRFPEGNAASVERMDSIKMKHNGPVPNGPDPFKFVAGELSPLSDFVKDMLASENPVLSMAASHFFEKVGRSTASSLFSPLLFYSLFHPLGVSSTSILTFFLPIHSQSITRSAKESAFALRRWR